MNYKLIDVTEEVYINMQSPLETKMERVKFSFLSFSLPFGLANAVCS